MKKGFPVTAIFLACLFITTSWGQHLDGSVPSSWNRYHLTYCKNACTCEHMRVTHTSLHRHKRFLTVDSRAWVCDFCPGGACSPEKMYGHNDAMVRRLQRDACISSDYAFKLSVRNDAAYELFHQPHQRMLQGTMPRFGLNRRPSLTNVHDELRQLIRQCAGQ